MGWKSGGTEDWAKGRRFEVGERGERGNWAGLRSPRSFVAVTFQWAPCLTFEWFFSSSYQEPRDPETTDGWDFAREMRKKDKGVGNY